MKKTFILLALTVVFAQCANASNSVGDSRKTEGSVSVALDGKPLNGYGAKWKTPAGKQVLIHVRLQKGDTIINDAYLATSDRQTTVFDKTIEHSYLAKTKGSYVTPDVYKDGFYFSAKPEIIAAGKVHLDFKATYAGLDKMASHEVAGEHIQLPQIMSWETAASIVLQSDKEIEFPAFGDGGGKTFLDIAGQHFDVVSSPVYVLKLSASIQ